MGRPPGAGRLRMDSNRAVEAGGRPRGPLPRSFAADDDLSPSVGRSPPRPAPKPAICTLRAGPAPPGSPARDPAGIPAFPPAARERTVNQARAARTVAALVLAAVAVVAILATLRLDPERLVEATGPASRLAFVLLVILEVVVAPIPGGVIAFLASAAWGFWQSWPLHYTGNVVGGLLVFWLARTLGKPFVDRHVAPRRRERIEGWLFGRPWLIWLVYALPVFPIDTISVALGLSALRGRRFAGILVTALPFYTGITAALGAYFGPFIPYLEWFAFVVFGLFLAGIGYLVISLRRAYPG